MVRIDHKVKEVINHIKQAEAKKAHLEAKEADRTGAKGGKKQGLFRKLSSRINKRRQEKIDKKLAEKE